MLRSQRFGEYKLKPKIHFNKFFCCRLLERLHRKLLLKIPSEQNTAYGREQQREKNYNREYQTNEKQKFPVRENLFVVIVRHKASKLEKNIAWINDEFKKKKSRNLRISASGYVKQPVLCNQTQNKYPWVETDSVAKHRHWHKEKSNFKASKYFAPLAHHNSETASKLQLRQFLLLYFTHGTRLRKPFGW